MYRSFRLVERRYQEAERISIALDNWPVHFHPFVLEELAKRHSRIELLPLPTYAPWTNPMEKVWGLLAKDVLNQIELPITDRTLRLGFKGSGRYVKIPSEWVLAVRSRF